MAEDPVDPHEAIWSNLADALQRAQDATTQAIADGMNVSDTTDATQSIEEFRDLLSDVTQPLLECRGDIEALAEAFGDLGNLLPASWDQSIASFERALRADRLATERFLSEHLSLAAPMSDEDLWLALLMFSTTPSGLGLSPSRFWEMTPREWWMCWRVWRAAHLRHPGILSAAPDSEPNIDPVAAGDQPERNGLATKLASATPSEPKSTVSQPASWDQITITFLSDFAVKVAFPGRTEPSCNYTEMGFEDRRNGGGKPVKAWEMLRGIASNQDQKWDKKTAQDLRKRLKTYFHVDSDPLAWGRKTGYTTAFQLSVSASFGGHGEISLL